MLTDCLGYFSWEAEIQLSHRWYLENNSQEVQDPVGLLSIKLCGAETDEGADAPLPPGSFQAVQTSSPASATQRNQSQPRAEPGPSPGQGHTVLLKDWVPFPPGSSLASGIPCCSVRV